MHSLAVILVATGILCTELIQYIPNIPDNDNKPRQTLEKEIINTYSSETHQPHDTCPLHLYKELGETNPPSKEDMSQPYK